MENRDAKSRSLSVTYDRSIPQRIDMNPGSPSSAPKSRMRSAPKRRPARGLATCSPSCEGCWIGRCKPDSVPSPFSAGDDHLSTRLLPGRIHLLSETCERAALDPVLSCTAWGLSCLLHCCWSGGLLPRLFTLTLLCRSSERRFVFCDTFHC